MIRERLRQRGIRDDSGIAMILVIGIGSVIAILIVAALSYSLNGVRSAQSDEDFNAALAAAYAGVEEYQSRLADDPTYLKYGNPASTFTTSTGSVVTSPPALRSNPAFNVGAGSWAQVSGSDGQSRFRYEVDNSKYAKDGTIRIRSTGAAGAETRSIVADMKQEGFLDYIYFTDFEMLDPVVSGANITNCVKYGWAGRPTTGCGEISFGGNDVINGPAHSNDTMRICNARFTRVVTTAYKPTSGVKYLAKDSSNNTCSGQLFDVGTDNPRYSAKVGMPATNSQLKKETRNDLPLDVPEPGCLYTGPTTIEFNANGTMTVRSPYTKATVVSGDAPATSGAAPARCGSPGVGLGQLGSALGSTVPVPVDNVIFVQSVPSTTPTDVNYTNPSLTPLLFTCTGGDGIMTGNGVGFPAANEYVASPVTSYGCRNGDVFVKGTVNGNVTLAADNYVYVTGDLKYADSQNDMIGLIGNNSVFVWNPIKSTLNGSLQVVSSGTNLLGASDRRIDAAILSVAHTFMVQNYNAGTARGKLTINGSIAQKFRGTVGTSSGGTIATGYQKNYQYDERFKYTAPPKFLSPVTSTYGVNIWVEVKPVFTSAGVYR